MGVGPAEIAGTPLASRAAANTIAQLLPPVVRVVLGVALIALLSRELGRDGLGQYALLFAYVALFNVVFNDWGLATIVLRDISQRPLEREGLLATAAMLQAVVSCGSYACMVLGVFVLGYPDPVRYGAMLYGLSLLVGPVSILSMPFQADLRLNELLAPSLVQALLTFVLSIVVLVVAGGSIVWLAAASLAAVIVQTVWIALLARRRFYRGRISRPAAVLNHWRTLIREAWPIGAASTLKVGWQQIPVLILGAYSLSATGMFHAANRAPQQLVVVPLALNATMFPLLARSWVADRVLFARQLDRLVGASLFVVVPAVIFGVATAGPVMRLLLGPEFDGAATPYALLLVTAGLLFPIIFLAEALNAAGSQRLNLALLCVLTPLLTAAVLGVAPRGETTGVAAVLLVGYGAYLAALLGAAVLRFGAAAPVSAVAGGVVAMTVGAVALGLTASAGVVVSSIVAPAAALAAYACLRPDIAALGCSVINLIPKFAPRPVAQEVPHGQHTS
ncbi:MAG: hypothetical protein HY873_01575 [Chloroflexi bacterium]|nr:hypothetical protein [Chloroflexota bacterium]